MQIVQAVGGSADKREASTTQTGWRWENGISLENNVALIVGKICLETKSKQLLRLRAVPGNNAFKYQFACLTMT